MELSKKEKNSLDKQLARLEGKKSDGIGLAIESAEAGERFRATIWAL